jgi:uncharacterized protein DUF5666
MKFIQKFAIAATGFVTLASLSACGGGGGSAPAAGTTTAIQQGTIQKFGSIFVNGMEIKTVGARLHLPDDAIPEVQLQNELEVRNHLKVGMVVTVRDVVDDNGQHHAAEIEYRDNLTGVVDDKGIDFISVMGQKIVVDDTGVLSGINVGSRVSVSGLPDDKGMLHASHMELKGGNEQLEAKGFVSDLTPSGFTLLMSPTAASGIPVTLGSGVTLPAGLKNGDFVEVKSAASGSPLVATRVELEDRKIEAGENEGVENEGFITNVDDLATLNRITLGNGQVVQFSSSTIFAGGASSDLTLGIRIEAEGAFSDGILMARKIVFKDNVRLGGPATAVDTTAQTINILGLNVHYGSATRFDNSGNTPLDPATLVGANLVISGNFSSGAINASRVQVKGNSNAAFIRGPVTAVTPTSSLTIAGLAINTTQAQFRGADESPMNAGVFFAAITLNSSEVKARWNPFTGDTSAPVQQVELEND